MSSRLILDSPISKRAEEQLGRLQFADGISDLILQAPANSSFRIGIYGEWGEGKTSVLKMVELRLKEKGQPCVWLLPWAYSDSNALWTGLLDSIATTLAVDKRAFKTFQKGHELLSKARGAADIDWRLKVANAAFGDSIEKVAQRFAKKQAERLLPAIYNQLGTRRLTVLIDDVDRTRPDMVPGLFLNLREALDLPGVFYVVGLSPKVVEAGLKEQHSGWEDASSFLEKVVEWPFYLPKPSDDQVLQFLRHHVHEQGGAISSDALESILDLVPRYPRKLKLLLRTLGSLGQVLSRFSADEADAATIYLTHMLKLEFPNECYGIAENPKELNDFLPLQIFRRDDANTKEALDKLSYLTGLQDVRRARLLQLIEGLTRRWSLTHQYSVPDTIWLLERPPLLTRKEIEDIFQQFQSEKQDNRPAFLKRLVEEAGHINPEKSNALFVGAIALRNNLFSAVIDCELEDDVKSGLVGVNAATELLRILVEDLKLFAIDVLTAEAWDRLFSQVAQWSPWRKPEYYTPIRDSELNLLQKAAVELSEELQTQILGRIRRFEFLPTQQASTEFQEVQKTMVDGMEETVCRRILARFTRQDGVEAFWKVNTSIEKEYAFDETRRFHHSPFRDELISLSKTAAANPVTQTNFLTYFRMLAHGAYEASSFPRQSCQTLLNDNSFRTALWTAALARPLNPRTVGSLRGMKANLKKLLKLDDTSFPVPKWWTVLEETFFSESRGGNPLLNDPKSNTTE